jgi:hypothetical protein
VFPQQGWAADALTPNAILHVAVQLPPVIHDVPLKEVVASAEPESAPGTREKRVQQLAHFKHR